jgi:alanine racemase
VRPTVAEINLNNLRENIRSLKKIHKGREFFCPMIKDNAYGHGDIEVAEALLKEDIQTIGVVTVDEALKLRQKFKSPSILIFGYFNEDAILESFAHNLTPVIGSMSALEFLPKDKKIKIHLKFDTGMARLGFPIEEAKKVLDFINTNKNIEVEGICTHFACGDDADSADGFTFQQMRKFSEVEKLFEGKFKYSHCLNSAALVAEFSGTESYHQNKNFLGARPGIAIYGYPPKIKDHPADLKPVMNLHTAIIQTRMIKKGDTVSYGGIWKAQRDSLIGTLCIGYGDGYPRNFSNNASMLFRGQRVPVIGRVCMDYVMIDLTDFKNESPIQIGERVTVWGYQGKNILSAEELAQNMNTISYELITRVGPRVPRIYVTE